MGMELSSKSAKRKNKSLFRRFPIKKLRTEKEMDTLLGKPNAKDEIQHLVKNLIQHLIEKDNLISQMQTRESNMCRNLQLLELELKKVDDRQRHSLETFPIKEYRGLRVPDADIKYPAYKHISKPALEEPSVFKTGFKQMCFN